ncbi:MAG: hypothetical protein LBV74_02470 [Tannerella sp.]|jgi:hypothetical protein|nr:hypothetical protein [Tannerella sp.]
MKKIFLLLLIFPLFISCSDDNKELTRDFEIEGITGTVWRGKSAENKQMELNFFSADTCYYISDLNDIVQPPQQSKYTYKYEYPKIYLTSTIIVIPGTPTLAPGIECVISKNKMSLMTTDNNQMFGSLTYQQK